MDVYCSVVFSLFVIGNFSWLLLLIIHLCSLNFQNNVWNDHCSEFLPVTKAGLSITLVHLSLVWLSGTTTACVHTQRLEPRIGAFVYTVTVVKRRRVRGTTNIPDLTLLAGCSVSFNAVVYVYSYE